MVEEVDGNIGNAADAVRRQEMALFLRSRRAALDPAEVGFNRSGRRRVRGLRREEVAQLANISVAWYTRLEQGRALHPTVQVLDAVADALLLNPEERRHLRLLAGHTGDDAGSDEGRVAPADLQQVLDALFPVPAVLMMQLVNRDEVIRSVIGRFRASAAEHPADPRFQEVVAHLAASSPSFRQVWAEYPVSRSAYDDLLHFRHADVGDIRLRPVQVRPVDHPGVQLHIHLPHADEDRRAIEALLASPTS